MREREGRERERRCSKINPLMLNDDCSGRTAPLTSKRCILYISSTNIGTEYFKHSIYSPFFPLQNAVCFINPTYLVLVLFTFYIQGVLKLKKNNSGAKRLKSKLKRFKRASSLFVLSLSFIKKRCVRRVGKWDTRWTVF